MVSIICRHADAEQKADEARRRVVGRMPAAGRNRFDELDPSSWQKILPAHKRTKSSRPVRSRGLRGDEGRLSSTLRTSTYASHTLT